MSTEGGLDPRLHALEPREHDDIFRAEIIPRVLDPTPPIERPWALVLAGRAGSGKTSLKVALLMRAVQEADQAGRRFVAPAEVGTDEMREFHPRWRQLLREDDVTAAFYTTYDCRRWVDEAVEYSIHPHLSDPAKGGPKPLVLDMQLNDPSRARDLFGKLKSTGYSLRVAFVAAPVAMSQLGALHRYQSMRTELGGGRFAANPEASDPGILASARMIDDETMVDVVEVYRRGVAEPAYRNEVVEPGRWRAPAHTTDVLDAEWGRPWTADETAWFTERTTELADQMEPRWWPHLSTAVDAALPFVQPGPHRSELQNLKARLAPEAQRGDGRVRPDVTQEPNADLDAARALLDSCASLSPQVDASPSVDMPEREPPGLDPS